MEPNSWNAPPIVSPFGGEARAIQALRVGYISELYELQFGVCVDEYLPETDPIVLYECALTGVRFWRPTTLAGDANFYAMISAAWIDYYKRERWEHKRVLHLAEARGSVLEIGCGPGYFLDRISESATRVVGLELTPQERVPSSLRASMEIRELGEMASNKPGHFDLVCSFQVLEHVQDPFDFLADAVKCLVRGGVLAVSVPNRDYPDFAEFRDPLDLPPHHMNSFSPLALSRALEAVGLVVEHTVRQPRGPARVPLTRNGSAPKPIQRVATTVAKAVSAAAFWTLREPGPAMVAIARKQ